MKREERIEVLRKLHKFAFVWGIGEPQIAITETLAELERLRTALTDLDKWLHFAHEWGENEALVPLSDGLTEWRVTLAKAGEAIADEEVKPGETPAI